MCCSCPMFARPWLALGMEPWASTPDELTQRMKADAEKWRQVIEKAGIPKQ